MSSSYKYHKIFLENNPDLGLKVIPKGWCIHHIDGNHSNNDPDNLQLLKNGQHSTLHHTNFKYSDESKAKMSKAHKGKEPWNKGIPMNEETKQKLTGRKHSDESIKKMSEAHKANPSNLGKHFSDETKKKISESSKGKHNKIEITDEMIVDIEQGMFRSIFKDKYGSDSPWRRHNQSKNKYN